MFSKTDSRVGLGTHRRARQPDRQALSNRRVHGFRNVCRVAAREDGGELARGVFDDGWAARLQPRVRARTIADAGVDLFLLRQLQRLVRPEIVTRSIEAD